MPLRVTAGGFATLEIDQALQLQDADLKAMNTKANPDRVKPSRLPGVRAEGSRLHAALLPASWNVIRARVS
jgi:alpha-N-arabinofuranosidase